MVNKSKKIYSKIPTYKHILLYFLNYDYYSIFIDLPRIIIIKTWVLCRITLTEIVFLHADAGNCRLREIDVLLFNVLTDLSAISSSIMHEKFIHKAHIRVNITIIKIHSNLYTRNKLDFMILFFLFVIIFLISSLLKLFRCNKSNIHKLNNYILSVQSNYTYVYFYIRMWCMLRHVINASLPNR